MREWELRDVRGPDEPAAVRDRSRVSQGETRTERVGSGVGKGDAISPHFQDTGLSRTPGQGRGTCRPLGAFPHLAWTGEGRPSAAGATESARSCPPARGLAVERQPNGPFPCIPVQLDRGEFCGRGSLRLTAETSVAAFCAHPEDEQHWRKASPVRGEDADLGFYTDRRDRESIRPDASRLHRIRRGFPKPCAEVRFLPGAPNLSCSG